MIDQDNENALTAARCGVLADNELGRYQLRWLIEHVGEDGVMGAVTRLAGRRRPYMTNIAVVLELAMPKSLPAAEPNVVPTRAPADMRGEMIADAERHAASNKARAERIQQALAAEATIARAAQAMKIATLKEKWRASKKLPPQPSEPARWG